MHGKALKLCRRLPTNKAQLLVEENIPKELNI